MVEAPRKFYRMTPGREVRLRWAYFVKCVGYETDPDTGEVTVVHCTYDPATRGGDAPDGRKVKSTLHWVPAGQALDARVRVYERLLFEPEEMDEEPEDVVDRFNPDSLEVLTGCRVEPSLADAAPGDRFQFERKGYFCVDPDSTEDRLVFNMTVAMRDQWKRIQQRRKHSG